MGPQGELQGCSESTDPNEVSARAMDGPQPQICREKIWTHVVRPQGAAQGRAASILHRHADFQSGVDTLLALYFNMLAGRPLPYLHHNA